jgi:hypothetical protein
MGSLLLFGTEIERKQAEVTNEGRLFKPGFENPAKE